MPKISFTSKGDLKRTETFLMRLSRGEMFLGLEALAKEGVAALAAATPVDSGVTANSWGYQIKSSRGLYSIEWTNSHVVAGAPIAILLQYGHGTGTGGYVSGQDYINPSIRPIFDKIAEKAWKVVTSA